MLKYSSSRLSVFSDLKTELLKIPKYLSFLVNEQAKAHANSASQAIEFLKGKSFGIDAATEEKLKKHREMYDSILRGQARKLNEDRAKYKAKLAKLGFKERLKIDWKNLKKSMQSTMSMEAGVMALLQHCAVSHAAKIAIENDINVQDVQFVLEEQQTPNSIEGEKVVVGYIDAPAASEEEFAMFVEKLQKACPVANRMNIEWRNRSFFEKDTPMKFPSQGPDAEGGAPYSHNLRGKIRSNLGEVNVDTDPFFNHLRHEGMSSRNPFDPEGSPSQSNKEGGDAGEPENQEDRANQKTDSKLSNQREQQRTESEAHVPEGTPGMHRMRSTEGDARSSSNSNSETTPTPNGDGK
ncbi:unnamed protein product [Phytomonas sp. EM1]|nr:unnamed protein product [Phytomonas sp. EM1]|eukprot:CCW60580.1 unnamed protein product [Phytomonas sp. isolate EM1]